MQPSINEEREELSAVFDRAMAKKEILARYRESRRRPGEPKLVLELQQTSVMSTPLECPESERRRRHAVEDSEYYIKLFFNGKEVSETSRTKLTHHFDLHFDVTFPLKIASWPSSIALQLWESNSHRSLLPDALVSDCFIPIPDPSATRSNMQLSKIDFSSIHPVHSPVSV